MEGSSGRHDLAEDTSNKSFTAREALFYHETIRPGKIEIIASNQERLRVDAFARYRIIDPLLFYQSVLLMANRVNQKVLCYNVSLIMVGRSIHSHKRRMISRKAVQRRRDDQPVHWLCLAT